MLWEPGGLQFSARFGGDSLLQNRLTVGSAGLAGQSSVSATVVNCWLGPSFLLSVFRPLPLVLAVTLWERHSTPVHGRGAPHVRRVFV